MTKNTFFFSKGVQQKTDTVDQRAFCHLIALHALKKPSKRDLQNMNNAKYEQKYGDLGTLVLFFIRKKRQVN